MSINKKYIGILLIAIAMLLSACSSDDAGVQTDTAGNESAGKVVQLVSYISPFVEKELSHRAAPTGFFAYTPDKTTNMGIYMLLPADWASPEEKTPIRYNTTTNKWQSNFEVAVDNTNTYTVYGYMPKTGDMSSSLAKSTADAATLTIYGMKAITTDDICIITGVKETVEGLKEGLFSWNTPTTGNQTFYINILMDHLYAAVLFSMKIETEYAKLRKIKLKKMELSTNKGSVSATISLTHNTTGASPITSVAYTPSDGSCEAVIFNSDEGVALDKTTALSINACFAPTLSAYLTLTSTYDVYDSKGNLIRQNCTATNRLPNLDATRGQKVQVNMTVNPTYLYVLSEPDLDNPTITIEN